MLIETLAANIREVNLSEKIPRRRFSASLGATLWIFAISLTGLLFFSFALPQDLTRTTPIYSRLVQIAFFGRVLRFHLSLLLIGIVVIALGQRRWRLCVAAGLVAIGGLIPAALSLLPHHTHTTIGSTLRVMSMNLKYTHSNAELFVDQIGSFNPDVLVLQDYTPYAESALNRAFGRDYPNRYMQPYTLQGLAIYSRRPFVGGMPQITFSKTRRQMRAVIDLDGKPIVIYIEHPYSPRSRQRIINNRLATIDLARQVRAERYPVIVAGDFNFTSDTPNEDALNQAGLNDAFEIAGHGRGSTWPVEPQWLGWLPGFRIDHIFVSHQMTCKQFFVGEYDGSDHLPIVADVSLYRSR